MFNVQQLISRFKTAVQKKVRLLHRTNRGCVKNPCRSELEIT